ncbi:MAG: CoA ester lyase [Sphingomonadales bacterium]|nr:CoA ester lyase [Sphingomonadales bacterium]
MIRSWLSVPADNAKKLASLASVPADAVVLDLAHGMDEDTRRTARAQAVEWLASRRQQVVSSNSPARWVRISGLETPHWRDDLVAVMPGAPTGIILTRALGPQQVQLLASDIYELEQANRLEHGSVAIIPQVGESPAAAIDLQRFAQETHPRLAGLAWSAMGLAESLGATRLYNPRGEWSDPLRLVRAATLLTARSKGLMAIETAHYDAKDAESMARAAHAARADGFTGMVAIHPRQVTAINRAFGARSE